MKKVVEFVRRERFFLITLGIALIIGAAMSIRGGNVVQSVVAAGGDPIYMKIEGIDGEATDRGHEKEIDILSWSWGMSQSSTSGAGGGGAGKVSVHDLSIMKYVDKASPDFMLACASGKHFPKIELTMRKTSESQDYLRYAFFDVFCDAYQVGGSASDPLPTESISFNFAKVVVEYKEQKEDGSLMPPERAGWDFKKNQAVEVSSTPSS